MRVAIYCTDGCSTPQLHTNRLAPVRPDLAPAGPQSLRSAAAERGVPCRPWLCAFLSLRLCVRAGSIRWEYLNRQSQDHIRLPVYV